MAEERIKQVMIEQQMKEAYLDYAMSVIVGRALPDVRDGLKPVHRRVLYGMKELGLFPNKAFRKSANVVGRVMASYHPHGDAAIYDTLVRMAQSFSLRYPLIHGQGNMGSVDGDPAASMRYTECKLAKIAEEMLLDLDKETVKFVPNYDNNDQEPSVLPAKLPNLLINGSTGIAVGMATNIPPHNLTEVADATIAYINNPEIDIFQLMEHIKGPDFPTGGLIMGSSGIKSAYKTGKGALKIRAKTTVEPKRIIVTEIPYMVNKSTLIEQIANLANEKIIPEISDIRDESDREGMRIVIELKNNENAEVVLNQLFKHSQLEVSFGIILLALNNNQPEIMGLKDIVKHYVDHRKEIVTNRTKFDLRKAEDRLHIVEGLQVALANIDDIVQSIKASQDAQAAREALMNFYKLSELQAQAILDLKLQKLTSLEQTKLNEEGDELKISIGGFKEILASEVRILGIIKTEIEELKQDYGDERKTEIVDAYEVIEDEDLIPDEDVVVTATYSGYVKKIPLEAYRNQKRGGVGIIGTETNEEDEVEHLFTATTHSTILCFTNRGRVHWLKAWQIPTASRYSKGKAIVNLLEIDKEERINAMIPIKKFDESHYLIMITKKGIVKKTSLDAYTNPRKGGIIAVSLRDDDELVRVRLTPGKLKFIIGTANGNAVKFDELDVRPMGRGATGVIGVRLEDGDYVVGLEVALEIGSLLTVTENGFGKRSPIADYRLTRRGSKGVINIKVNERNGKVIGIKTVLPKDEILIMSAQGVAIRMSAADVSVIGRNTQGVRLMRLKEGDKVSTVTRIITNKDTPK